MGKKFDSLEGFIQAHIQQLFESSGLPDGEDSLEVLASAWLQKKHSFEKIVAENNMEELDYFSAASVHGSLLMTYSGSLINVGPLRDGTRRVAYASIGLRKDVPNQDSEDQCILDHDLRTDTVANFKHGPIRRTSPILKIACFRTSLPEKAETERLTELTNVMSENFVSVNRTIGEKTA